MSTFEENLKMIFSESQYELCMQNRKTDPVYRQFQKKYDKLFNRIRKRLGTKHQQLLFKLEELGSDKGSIDNDLIYLQGMIDCTKLLRMIQMI
ncbi:MAG: hypothetical protein FWC62_04850 [Firmicutes bacterium]|nr:hypothetical protein [Bacillota bacterium]